MGLGVLDSVLLPCQLSPELGDGLVEVGGVDGGLCGGVGHGVLLVCVIVIDDDTNLICFLCVSSNGFVKVCGFRSRCS